ncbi:STAS domain-containing protein [Streptomyces liliiviolaceus]|uniref:STAS domain-containing protein n=1 Tax=Streptomyces liliiviolaceus TaxID=2823109 RepID=UPI003899DB13
MFRRCRRCRRAGDLDHAAREHIENVLKPLADVTPARTVADLSGVTFMDSSGINILITAYRNAVVSALGRG